MTKFTTILKRAEKRKGGPKALQSILPKPISPAALAKKSDDRCLSIMAKCIFQSGFVWRVIEKKWPEFEEAFFKFDLKKLSKQGPRYWEGLGQDKRIVRNMTKILAVQDNVKFVTATAKTHGSFAKFIKQWPADDHVGLFLYLKKQGSRLGGTTGQRAVRMIGKDSFMLSGDVVQCLQAAGLDIKETPSSKRELKLIQATFNTWHEATGLPYAHLSRIAAYSVGQNYAVKEIQSYLRP